MRPPTAKTSLCISICTRSERVLLTGPSGRCVGRRIKGVVGGCGGVWREDGGNVVQEGLFGEGAAVPIVWGAFYSCNRPSSTVGGQSV